LGVVLGPASRSSKKERYTSVEWIEFIPRTPGSKRKKRKITIMTTAEERMQILNMVAEGTISADEGAKLLAALESEKKRAPRSTMTGPSTPRWVRVRVTDLETGRSKVNVNLPMSLVEVGTRVGARFAPELEAMNITDIIEQIKSGAQGKIVEVEDLEDGERVEIYVE
jgi:hypothetical protein